MRLSSAQRHPRRSRASLIASYVGRLADANATSDVQQYLALVASLTSAAGIRSLRFEVDATAEATRIARRFGLEDPPEPTTLRALQRFELQTYLPGDLLCKEDRATMAVGLEGRVPLLDDSLVRLAERATEESMISLRHGKILLRQLAARFDTPLTQLKRGFAIPLGTYFRGPWRAEAREWFGALDSDLVDRDAALSLLADEEPQATDLWMLATLTAWEERLRRIRSAGTTSSPTSFVRSRWQ